MMRCHVCDQNALRLFPEFPRFKRVTSDCKPWPEGGQLGVCEKCGCVQALVNEAWRKESATIYQNYTIYHQGGGAEQNVFESSGLGTARSDRLLAALKGLDEMPRTGRLLDLGCGNGGFLKSFNRHFPEWQLAGLEWDDRYRSQVESLPRVQRLYTGSLTEVPGQFDAISMLHVLEHIEAPRQQLEKVKAKLKPGGVLIIQLPYYVENPFELFVADHASHFDSQTILALLDLASLRVDHVETQWVPKELSIVARNSPPVPSQPLVPDLDWISSVLGWLESVVNDSRSLMKNSPRFGLFGSSIAAAWLFGELGKGVDFFVDEDPCRVGGQYFGLPVYHPSAVPGDSDVYVALAPKISRDVTIRLQSSSVRYHGVPVLPAKNPASVSPGARR
jgi:SAM-dependent methyltransferase